MVHAMITDNDIIFSPNFAWEKNERAASESVEKNKSSNLRGRPTVRPIYAWKYSGAAVKSPTLLMNIGTRAYCIVYIINTGRYCSHGLRSWGENSNSFQHWVELPPLKSVLNLASQVFHSSTLNRYYFVHKNQL